MRLADVAQVEMGDEYYSTNILANGHPAAGMAIKLALGANALSTAGKLKSIISELQSGMPASYTVTYPLDSTEFIKASIEEVVKTLREAILLVVAMFVFFAKLTHKLDPRYRGAGSVYWAPSAYWRCLAIINTLTMFGMVLAIGLLVDDAIVVVKNV